VRFGFEQRWDAPIDEVLAVYVDPAFWTSLSGLSTTSPPELLGVERDGNRAIVRLRYRLAVSLPKEASRFIDPDEVAWDEEHQWDLDAKRADVAFRPLQAAALLRASATSELTTDGDDTVRTIKGELKIRIPLLGGRVEHAIVGGIGNHLVEEADAVADQLG
jgi:hypothetical protein